MIIKQLAGYKEHNRWPQLLVKKIDYGLPLLTMILEVAILNVRPGMENDFESAFSTAQQIISGSKGYISHQLQKCIEIKNQYILLVNWEAIDDHVEGFRKGKNYEAWKKLLHHFYDPFPIVEHYSVV